MKGLELLGRWSSIGSLAVTDKFSLDEMHWFQMNSQNIQVSQVSENENFPGEFLKPSFNNTLLSSEMLPYKKFRYWKDMEMILKWYWHTEKILKKRI